MFLEPQDVNDLIYFFNEFAGDAGLASCFGRSLCNAEAVFVPYTAETDGPIPKLHSQAHTPFVDPYDDSLLEKVGSTRRIRTVLSQMQQAGHGAWVDVLCRLYGPFHQEIRPLRAIFGDLAHILDLTQLGSMPESRAILSQPWSSSISGSTELMDQFLPTLKVQALILRRRAEENFNEVAARYPRNDS